MRMELSIENCLYSLYPTSHRFAPLKKKCNSLRSKHTSKKHLVFCLSVQPAGMWLIIRLAQATQSIWSSRSTPTT